MELNIFCCKPDLKTFLKSKAGAEKNEKTRREFCVHKRFTNSWKLDETEREKELPLIKGFPFQLYSKSHDKCYCSFSITKI